MRDALSKKIVDIEPSGIRKFFDIVSEMPDAISLGVGEPDFDTPYRVREEGIYSLEKGRTFYTSNAGLKELRDEISRYIARKYNLNYSAEDEIMVTVGGSEAIDVALRCMVDPGDEVLIPQPCYVSYVPCAVMADAKPVAIELKAENEFKLTKEELIASITDKTKILILAYPNNPTGAIMTKEELAELVDFFSIGTNDLTQYTLAIDRQNNRLDRFYNPHHEAVLRMIEMTVQGAHKHGKWVGICGELGADTTLTERFIKMGIDELSVSPSMVLGVRSRICEME